MSNVDAYNNPLPVAAGELIESSWGTAAAGRVVKQFPTKAALDTWAAPDGALGGTSESGGKAYVRRNGAWVLVNPDVGLIVGGTTLAVACPPAGEVECAYLNLPAGYWLVHYDVMLSATSVFVADVKVFGLTTSPRVQSLPAPEIQVGAAKNYYSMSGLSRGSVRISVNVGAPYAANPVNTYADPSNHQIFAVGVQAF